ncbi:MAG: phenylacetate--CoA ligase family protein [Alphaproteobacteria bacterium]
MPDPGFDRLRVAIARCWDKSDFHRQHWLKAGVADGWVPSAPEELDRLPAVTKEDILAAERLEPPWGGNLCIDASAIAQVHLTSGTSGIGQERYACSASDVEVMGASWGPQFEAIGLEAGDVAIFTIPVSFMCAGLSALEGARIHGLVPLATGIASKKLILDFLTDQRAAYLYGIESFLLQLASEARNLGLAGTFGDHLKGVQSVGASPHLVRTVKGVFGARVFEVYGCTQAAAKIATTCRLGVETGTVHFRDEHLHIETRDPETGMPVTEGRANIVISTTYRQASPVIRYDMKDSVELVPAGSCPCGDPRPGYRPGSVARTDSMMKIRGMNVWPQAVEGLLLAHPGVDEFRGEATLRADGSDELLIRIRPGASTQDVDELTAALEETIRRESMIRPRIVLDRDIPDSAGDYKVRRWQDTRKEQKR